MKATVLSLERSDASGRNLGRIVVALHDETGTTETALFPREVPGSGVKFSTPSYRYGGRWHPAVRWSAEAWSLLQDAAEVAWGEADQEDSR